MRGWRAVCLAVVLWAGALAPARAEQTIVSQKAWADAQLTVTTADGPTLACVTPGLGEGVPPILLHGFNDKTAD